MIRAAALKFTRPSGRVTAPVVSDDEEILDDDEPVVEVRGTSVYSPVSFATFPVMC
jgi:hypothetical protein